LPAPFGPSTPKVSPARISSEIPSTARVAPNVFRRLSTRIMGFRGGAGAGRGIVVRPSRRSAYFTSAPRPIHSGASPPRYQSGQLGQTVNLVAPAFGGSNPSLGTTPLSARGVLSRFGALFGSPARVAERATPGSSRAGGARHRGPRAREGRAPGALGSSVEPAPIDATRRDRTDFAGPRKRRAPRGPLPGLSTPRSPAGHVALRASALPASRSEAGSPAPAPLPRGLPSEPVQAVDRRPPRPRMRVSLLEPWLQSARGVRVRGGRSSMVELQPSKLVAWVRFPSPAP
jgi:hypothetical protein